MKNKKTVLIHIGTEKTGTSTIQEFLHLNRDLISKHGVGYLKSPGLRNNRKIVSYCRNSDILDDYLVSLGIVSIKSQKSWRKTFKIEFEDELRELLGKVNYVIISSEHFHSRFYSEKEILNLQELLRPFFQEFKIIVYLRRQDQVATSLYSTACRTGHPRNRMLPLGVSEKSHYYNYFNFLEKWSAVFGHSNIIPRIFEKEKLLYGNLISDFMFHSEMIIKDFNTIMPDYQNEALSETVQEVILSFNTNFPMKINNKYCVGSAKLRQNLLKKLEPAFPGKPKMPCQEDALRFYQVFVKSNNRLANKWFNIPGLFSEDFSMYPEENVPFKKEYEIFDHVFSFFAEILDKNLLVPRELIKKIDLNGDSGAVLRDVALLFEHAYPEIAYYLMKEALKNRPNGQFIKDKIQNLALRIE
jgi:hypothetical protein